VTPSLRVEVNPINVREALCQLLLECANAGFVLAVPLGVRHHDSNAPHARALLRVRRERPRRRTAE
jgi:hypothetical protein